MKNNDSSIYPKICCAKPEEANIPMHKEAFVIKMDETTFTGNALHYAYLSRSSETQNGWMSTSGEIQEEPWSTTSSYWVMSISNYELLWGQLTLDNPKMIAALQEYMK